MLRAFAFILMVGVLAASASAEEIEVKMLDKGSDGAFMVFEPAYIEAHVGDVITFVPTHLNHNAETIRGMLPEGAEGFRGKMNEKIAYTVTHEGVVGIKCLPHYGLGMVALIVTPEPTNLEDAKKVRQFGKAKQRFNMMFEQYEASLATKTADAAPVAP